MDADERAICVYLKSFPDQFIAAREIARRAGGKWRFREDPEWAAPVLARLVEKGLIEPDSTGHFKLRQKPQATKPKQWVSPQLKKILEQSGKTLNIEESNEEF
jgi:hypothetical protein